LKITVNGEDRATAALTLADLCGELGLSDAKIATARNGEFVPAGKRSEVNLADGDAVEVLSPRQGG
jgi:sulfur carrier protein